MESYNSSARSAFSACVIAVITGFLSMPFALSAPLVGGVSFNDDLPKAQFKTMTPKLDGSATVEASPPKQDCICFNGNRVAIKEVNGSLKLVDSNDQWILDFAQDSEQGRAAMNIIDAYKLNNICFVGRPFPAGGMGGRMMYFLQDGQAPSGPALKGEDVISFDNSLVKAEQVRGTWKVTCGDMWMLDFGDDQSAAENAAAIIKYHKFRYQGYIGRPGPSMMYFLK